MKRSFASFAFVNADTVLVQVQSTPHQVLYHDRENNLYCIDLRTVQCPLYRVFYNSETIFCKATSKMPTLYTAIGSPPGRTVMMLQGLLDLKLDIKPLEPVTRHQDTPEFTKKNPMRTVPIFEDEEGFCLADSHAIMIHFMEKYAKPEFQYLYPKDMNKRSTINSRLFFDCGILFPRLRNVMAPAIVGKLTEISKTNKWQFNDAYRTLECYLSESKYIADNEMTIADISISSTLSAMDGLYGIDGSKFPQTKSWLKMMSEKDFYQKYCKEGNEYFVMGIKTFIENNKAKQQCSKL